MSAKHQDSEYRRNAAIIRAQVRRAHRLGQDVECRRCPYPIDPEQRFDVGHIDADGGHDLENLAPEHRSCNRKAGGRTGAAILAARRGRATRMLPL